MKTRHLFTLIELLVVVAIISILASLLLPALSRAREMARGAACMNNFHQLNLAWISYADDYNDDMVMSFNGAQPNPSYYNSYWTSWSMYLIDSNGQATLDMLRCPSTPSQRKDGSFWTVTYHSYQGGAHYAYNFDALKNGNMTLTKPNGSTTNVGRPNKISRIVSPDSKAAFLDFGIGETGKAVNLYYGYNASAMVYTGMYIPGGALSPNGAVKLANGTTSSLHVVNNPIYLNDFNGGRHGGRDNVLHVDGHVVTYPSAKLADNYYTNTNSAAFPSGNLFARWDIQ